VIIIREFTLFSTEHFTYILGYAGLAVLAFYLPKIFKFNIDKFAKISGYFILVEKFIELTYRYIVFNEPFTNLLPFDMCNYTLVLAAFMMIFRSKKIFNLVYFWSIGAILAIATPDIRIAFPNYSNISFFVTHYYIYFAVFYCLKYFKFIITFDSLKKSFIYINGIMLVLFPLNFLLGTNYMFLKYKPISSPMDFLGPWPYYIISLEVVMIVLFTLMYLPFRKNYIKTK
jgi:hypothetical integral membrane protein (TIGR02206 family)